MTHKNAKRPSEIGVVLSSGFFGFFAHAGFLAALRELDIEPAGFSGSSSGAIVAAMAASGMSDTEIRDMLFSVRKEDFWDPDPWGLILRRALRLFRGYGGYLNGLGFQQLLRGIPAANIQDCRTPLAIAATNLSRRCETVFTRGDLIKAIHASGAVPMLFKPVEIDGSLYVDGGVTNKAPVKALADLVHLKKIIVHFISSANVEEQGRGFLERIMAPWHVQYVAVNIARQEAYRMQVDLVRTMGVEVVEVKTEAPSVGPNRLHRGPRAYAGARASALEILSKEFPG